VKILILLFAMAGLILADGGTLILRQTAGPLTVSVFSSPSPLRVGTGDISVMVQKTADKSSVLDAKVNLRLSHSSPEGISTVFVPTSHDKATNKLLYASNVSLNAEGPWKLLVTIDSKLGNAEVAGNIEVLPRQAPIISFWPYFALVPLLILVFILNRWLRSRMATSRNP
jgi:hypothetical protein